MDCGTAGTAAGIDPKILENWQSDSTFSIASWDQSAHDQPPEWDTSQGSSQGDAADLVDLGALQGSLAKGQSNELLLEQPGDYKLHRGYGLFVASEKCRRANR